MACPKCGAANGVTCLACWNCEFQFTLEDMEGAQRVLQDAALNAVVQLDCFANLTASFVNEDRIGELKPLFSAYIAAK